MTSASSDCIIFAVYTVTFLFFIFYFTYLFISSFCLNVNSGVFFTDVDDWDARTCPTACLENDQLT